MAITRLHTWVAGEVLTASDLNAEFNNIIDNLSAAITGTMGDGSVTSPGLQFFTDSDTGLYKIGENALGVAAGGRNVFVASEYFQASAFRFPVKTATEAVFTAQPGRAYWQTAEGSVHIHTGTVIARVPALSAIHEGRLVGITNPTGVSGATVFSQITVGANLTLTASTLSATAGLQSIQVFTSSGTWTRPANILRVFVEVVGGGGAGGAGLATGASQGSAGHGGGGGGMATGLLDVSAIASSTITVGAGGTGGTGVGPTGSNSVWSDGTNTITGNGGVGGQSCSAVTPPASADAPTPAGGSGTAGSSGTVRRGDSGGPGLALTFAGYAQGGFGGGSAHSGQTAGTYDAAGAAGVANTGAGGSGGSRLQNQASIANGGSGGSGIVIVYEYR